MWQLFSQIAECSFLNFSTMTNFGVMLEFWFLGDHYFFETFRNADDTKIEIFVFFASYMQESSNEIYSKMSWDETLVVAPHVT